MVVGVGPFLRDIEIQRAFGNGFHKGKREKRGEGGGCVCVGDTIASKQGDRISTFSRR